MTNPIAEAVLPLKAAAVERATQSFDKHVAHVLTHLEACGWDLDVAYPRPKGNVGRAQYITEMGKHGFGEAITKATWVTRSMRDPNTRVKSEEKIAKVREQVQAQAEAQYDAFVAKLVGKIGEVTEAALRGSHVWGYSFLDVVKADGTRETWKTQQIVNVSCLGKVFNQWPSRKVK